MISVGRGGVEEQRLEDYVVGGLVDFDDVSYDDHAELLYDLAAQIVTHFRAALNYCDDDIRKVLRQHQKAIAEFVHAQVTPHYLEEAGGYEVTVTCGFTDLSAARTRRRPASPSTFVNRQRTRARSASPSTAASPGASIACRNSRRTPSTRWR